MNKITFAALLVTFPFQVFAKDVCRDGPPAIASFVQARDAGVPQEVVMKSLDDQPGDDPVQNGFYRDMANWTYRYPQFDANRITFMLFRDCYGRQPMPGMTIP